MLKDLISKENLNKKVDFFWSVNGGRTKQSLELKDIDLYYPIFKNSANSKGEFIVKNGNVFIKWKDIPDLTDILDKRYKSVLNDCELVHKDQESFNEVFDRLLKNRHTIISKKGNPKLEAALSLIKRGLDSIEKIDED